MKTSTRIIGSTLVALAMAPAATLAQSPQSANASVTITVAQPPLNLATIQSFDFGTVYTNAGIVSSGGTNFARWDGQTTVNSAISASFTIPSMLVGTSGSVLFSCGSQSAILKEGGIGNSFDPSTGHAGYNLSVNGSFTITLGEGSVATPPASELCQVDVTGAAPDTYTGTITLTVAVI